MAVYNWEVVFFNDDILFVFKVLGRDWFIFVFNV